MNLISLKTLLHSNIHVGRFKEKKGPNYLGFNKIYFAYKNYNILNIYWITKFLIISYIFFYKIALKQENILFINSKKLGSTVLKEVSFISNNYYINNNWQKGMLTNWIYFQPKLLILKWLLYSLQIIFTQTFYLSPKLIRYMFNLFIYLKIRYYGMLGMVETPPIMFIIDKHKDKEAFKESIISKKVIITITEKESPESFLNIPINNNSLTSIYILMQILASASVKGSSFVFN